MNGLKIRQNQDRRINSGNFENMNPDEFSRNQDPYLNRFYHTLAHNNKGFSDKISKVNNRSQLRNTISGQSGNGLNSTLPKCLSLAERDLQLAKYETSSKNRNHDFEEGSQNHDQTQPTLEENNMETPDFNIITSGTPFN